MDTAPSPWSAAPAAHVEPVASAAPPPAGRQRVWPALVTLYFLSPVIAEMLSGSTPPLAWLNPINWIVQPALYGSGAILIREIMRRRGLGWGNLLLLGAAYGVLEEGLDVQTWFNFVAPKSPSHSAGFYGVAFGTNWLWAFSLTAYHAIISITIPIVLVELFYPRIAAQPWLGRKGIIAFAVVLSLISLLLALALSPTAYAKQGYTYPPLGPYLLAAAIMVTLFGLGLSVRFPPPAPSERPAPRLWVVRLTVLLTCVAFFAADYITPHSIPFAPAAFVVSAAVVAFGLWRVRSWSARRGWDARYRLAVAMGVALYFLLFWSPLVEFAVFKANPIDHGLVLADFLFVLGLSLFGWRLARRIKRAAAETREAV